MPPGSDYRRTSVVKNMRMLEKALSELHIQIRLYSGQYQQSAVKIEAIRNHYRDLYGESQISLMNSDPEYLRASEKMRIATRKLEALEKERVGLNQRLQDAMSRK